MYIAERLFSSSLVAVVSGASPRTLRIEHFKKVSFSDCCVSFFSSLQKVFFLLIWLHFIISSYSYKGTEICRYSYGDRIRAVRMNRAVSISFIILSFIVSE